jgi:hypothetical protein
MEMKETVNSLRAYFIVGALVSDASIIFSLGQFPAPENVIAFSIVMFGLLTSLMFFLIGIRIKNYLIEAPKFIKAVILLNLANVFIAWLMVIFTAGACQTGQTIFYPVISSLISLYLWRNTERLSREEIQTRANSKQGIINMTSDSAQMDSWIVIYACVTAVGWLLLLFAALFILPRIIPIFAQLKVDLPKPTILVLNSNRPIALLIGISIGLASVIVPVVKKSRIWAKNMLLLVFLTGVFAFGAIYFPITKFNKP